MNLNSIANKVLTGLRVRAAIGGLELSDTALHYTILRDGAWQTVSLRLPQGLLRDGQITDEAEFVDALRALRRQIVGPRDFHARLNVVVSLSSINIYTQVFSLPMIEGENLEKAIQLNIQMVSPNAASETYSGWQLVGRDQSSVRLEILSAFINRGVVDAVRRSLAEAGFVPYSIESRALSLVRLVREAGAGIDRRGSYLLVNLDASGLEFVIIRQGQLYFQYFNAWRDIADAAGEIDPAAFRAVVVRNFNQVMNFYGSHWGDPVQGVVVAATALEGEIREALASATSVPVILLELTLGGLQPDWYVSLGSGLRGLVPRSEDRDISLLGVSAQEEFRRHQLIDFGRFWRLVVPVSFVVLALAFGGGGILLAKTRRSLDAQLATNTLAASESKKINDIRKRIVEFNRSLSAIATVRALEEPQFALADQLLSLLTAEGATLTRFIFRSPSEPISVYGRAPSQEHLVRLQKRIASDPLFQNVDIPLSGVVQSSDGVTFSMNFSIASSKAP